MKISKGVEWAVHATALLVGLPEGRGLKNEALAQYHGVPVAYMAKQLQALSKAGIIYSSRGARGGYRLAIPPAQISLWQITSAIEGTQPAFRCSEIRQNGPCKLKPDQCQQSCPIASAFLAAEQSYRNALSAVSIADIAMKILNDSSPQHLSEITQWLASQSIQISISN